MCRGSCLVLRVSCFASRDLSLLMPFRALMWTVLTVALALLAVGIWVRAVEPMVMTVKINAGVSPATQPTTESAAGSAANKTSSPEKQMGILVRGTLLLSFVLICVLLVVGSFGAFQEWVRYRAGTARRHGKDQIRGRLETRGGAAEGKAGGTGRRRRRPPRLAASHRNAGKSLLALDPAARLTHNSAIANPVHPHDGLKDHADFSGWLGAPRALRRDDFPP